MKTTKPYIFEVRGRGHFPLDMLRYDECTPLREGDSLQMNESFFSRSSRDITLTSSKKYGPTKGRWNSFGWNVLPRIPQ